MSSYMIKYGKAVFVGLLFAAVLAACAKDDYYMDGGLANPNFDGNMLEYLESKPVEFDTIAQLVRLAGLDEKFQTEELTFFAPSDREIKNLIGYVGRGGLNHHLYGLGKDTVRVFADVDSLIWKKYLERHLFRGTNMLADYPQVDHSLRQIYPGQNYYSLNNTVLNIGVVYHDVNGIKYAGYRQLSISYIPDLSRPDEGWRTVMISSSDIKPRNGVVHTLVKENVGFGFDVDEFFNDVAASK